MTNIELQALLKQYPDEILVCLSDVFRGYNEEITGLGHQQSGTECLVLYSGDHD